MKVSYYLLFLILLVSIEGFTQTEESENNENHALKMTARSNGQEVLLRWAPTTPTAWKQINKVGVRLLRFTIQKNNELLPFNVRSIPKEMTTTPIRPFQTQAEWQPLMERDDYAAIGAQAIFGADFKVSTTSSEELSNGLVNQAQEETNRFGFGLFAADQSFDAAEAMGLAFVDKQVNADETYLYRVFPAQNTPISIDTGFTVQNVSEVFPLPKVQKVAANFGDGQATISWDKKLFGQFYTSYIVERSEDGQNWSSLRDKPVISPSLKEEGNDFGFLVDTLIENNRPYFYRVIGRTAFGEFGPPSDPVQGMGIDPLPEFYPTISSVLVHENGLNISWDFNQSEESKITGFTVLRGQSDQGPFEVLPRANLLPPHQRFFIDDNPLAINYYIVVAKDVLNREMASFSALGQIMDETPPVKPQNLRGTILKNGVMVVSWEENIESDLLGYRVYISNSIQAEFTQITNRPIADNFLVDTISLDNLSPTLFVKIAAYDYRHNRSEWSEITKLSKPDTLKPTAPVIQNLEANNNQLLLEWAPSSSLDVIRHEVYRRPVGTADWELLKTVNNLNQDNTQSIMDDNAAKGQLCEYKVVAVDNGELTSESKIVSGQIIDDFIRTGVTNLTAQADRRNKAILLEWAYPEPEKVKLFLIYRSVGDPIQPVRYEGLSLIDSQNNRRQNSKLSFVDKKLQMNTQYTYWVKTICKDGGESPLGDAVQISF